MQMRNYYKHELFSKNYVVEKWLEQVKWLHQIVVDENTSKGQE